MVGGPGAVYTHQGLDGAIRTDLATSTESYVGSFYKIGDTLGAIHVDAQSFVYVNASQASHRVLQYGRVGAADVKTNSAAVGTVMGCSRPSRAGGPQKIADQLTNPVSVRIDDPYVTWMTYGTPGNKDGAVYRKRR